jgi:membrane protease YdiL (CAAX protease family)
MITLFDPILVLIVAVAWPLYAALVQYPRLKRGVAAGVPGIRIRAYLQTIAEQWSLVAVTMVLWLTTGRTIAELGLGLMSDWRLWLGVVLVLAVIVLLEAQRRRVTASEGLHREFRSKVEQASALLPQDSRELSYFSLVSVTAGVCEEVLFRGYLMWYLSAFLGIAPAILLSSVLFGLAHLYQGKKGILQTGIVGLVFAILYVVTGALWAPMLIHALVDMNSGVLWYQIKDTPVDPSNAVPRISIDGDEK